jgi:hypothetical protein
VVGENWCFESPTASSRKTLGVIKQTDTMKKTLYITALLTLIFLNCFCQCTPAIAGQSIVCENHCVTLVASGATSYTWSPSFNLSSSTGSSVSACPASSINYTITGQSGTCISTSEFLLNVEPTIYASVTSKSLCLNSSITLTAGGGNQYTWSPSYGLNATNSSTVTANPTITTTYTVVVSNFGDCADTTYATVTVYTCSGLAELSEEIKIDLAPNPAFNKFSIINSFGHRLTIDFFDIHGKLILTRSTNETLELSTDNLLTGIYFVVITSNKKRLTKKLIVSKT